MPLSTQQTQDYVEGEALMARFTALADRALWKNAERLVVAPPVAPWQRLPGNCLRNISSMLLAPSIAAVATMNACWQALIRVASTLLSNTRSRVLLSLRSVQAYMAIRWS